MTVAIRNERAKKKKRGTCSRRFTWAVIISSYLAFRSLVMAWSFALRLFDPYCTNMWAGCIDPHPACRHFAVLVHIIYITEVFMTAVNTTATHHTICVLLT